MVEFEKLIDLSPQEGSVLVYIYTHDTKSWKTPQDIKEEFNITYIRANQILKKLYDRDLVVREKYIKGDNRIRYRYGSKCLTLESLLDLKYREWKEKILKRIQPRGGC